MVLGAFAAAQLRAQSIVPTWVEGTATVAWGNATNVPPTPLFLNSGGRNEFELVLRTKDALGAEQIRQLHIAPDINWLNLTGFSLEYTAMTHISYEVYMNNELITKAWGRLTSPGIGAKVTRIDLDLNLPWVVPTYLNVKDPCRGLEPATPAGVPFKLYRYDDKTNTEIFIQDCAVTDNYGGINLMKPALMGDRTYHLSWREGGQWSRYLEFKTPRLTEPIVSQTQVVRRDCPKDN